MKCEIVILDGVKPISYLKYKSIGNITTTTMAAINSATTPPMIGPLFGGSIMHALKCEIRFGF